MGDQNSEVVASFPKDKADLFARIQREWSALMQTIENLTPERITIPDTGGWSIKDNLAHLTEWEQFMLRCHLQGQPPHQAMQIDAATFELLDENGLNAILYERNKNRSLEEVLTGLRNTHEQVIAALEHMSFTDLLQPRYADDSQGRPLLAWVIGNTYEHYQEHRRTIQALVTGERA